MCYKSLYDFMPATISPSSCLFTLHLLLLLLVGSFAQLYIWLISPLSFINLCVTILIFLLYFSAHFLLSPNIYVSFSLSLSIHIHVYVCACIPTRAHKHTHIFVDDLTSPVPTIFLLECKLLREITCLFYSLPYLQLLEQYLTSDRCSQILNELIKKLISLFSVYCKYNTVQSG